MSDKKYEVYFWFIIFALAIGFYFVMVIDRSMAQDVIEGDGITPEGELITNKSSTTEVPLKSTEQIFLELPFEVKYELTLEKKEAADNLASKYAKLYDSCRFK